MHRMLLIVLAFQTALLTQSTRAFRFAHIQDPQSLMEAATTIRSTGEIRDAKLDADARTLTISGAEPWQLDLAGWLFDKLDRPATDRPPVIERYEIRGAVDPAVRIFHPEHAPTPESLQELTIVVRSVVEIRRAFLFNATRAAVMRGTPDEVAAAEWLLRELDQNSNRRPVSEIWRLPNTPEGVIRVFYLKPSLTIEELQKHATSVRREAQIRRMFTYNSAHAVALRGTADQVALAEKLLVERQLLVN